MSLGIFPYRSLAVLKISRKSGADRYSIPLVSQNRLGKVGLNQVKLGLIKVSSQVRFKLKFSHALQGMLYHIPGQHQSTQPGIVEHTATPFRFAGTLDHSNQKLIGRNEVQFNRNLSLQPRVTGPLSALSGASVRLTSGTLTYQLACIQVVV